MPGPIATSKDHNGFLSNLRIAELPTATTVPLELKRRAKEYTRVADRAFPQIKVTRRQLGDLGPYIWKHSEMNVKTIERFLSRPTEANLDTLLDSQDVVFWVDWREEDDVIVKYCEDILKTNQLAAELHDIEAAPGFELSIIYKGETSVVPLVIGPADRHITLCSLNEAISADFEIRFCVDSAGGDALAFLPLPHAAWADTKEKFGDIVESHFSKIEAQPNLFTEGYGYQPKPSWESLARNPSQKTAAIKAYRDEKACGLSEAKSAVESFIEGLK